MQGWDQNIVRDSWWEGEWWAKMNGLKIDKREQINEQDTNINNKTQSYKI